MKHISNYLNSDMLNKLLDKKLTTFSMFLVKDDNIKKYYLYFNDKTNGTEIRVAEFKSYTQYQRWLTEACIMRIACKPEEVKKVRAIYKNLFAFSRDPKRIDPFKEQFAITICYIIMSFLFLGFFLLKGVYNEESS